MKRKLIAFCAIAALALMTIGCTVSDVKFSTGKATTDKGAGTLLSPTN